MIFYIFPKYNNIFLNPLTRGVHQKLIYTLTNLLLKATGLFKYVWPFSGRQALKG